MKRQGIQLQELKPTLRKDGRFTLQVRISPGPKGRKTVYGQTAEECLEKAEVLVSASRPAEITGSFPANSWGDFYERIFVPTLSTRWTGGTRLKYKSLAKVHLLPTFGRFPIAAIEHEHILSYRDSLRDLGPHQQHAILSYLREVFTLARRMRKIASDPTEFVPFPRKPGKKERVTPGAGDFELLQKAASGTPMAGPILAARRIGLRRGEVCGLQWQHMDSFQNIVRVHQQRDETGQLVLPKGGKKREIGIPASLMEDLLQLGDQSSLFVFTDDDGAPLEPLYLTKAMPGLCRAAGIPEIDFHELRAHFATDLSRHADPYTVAAVLGHSAVDTTMIYVDQRSQVERAAIAAAMVDTEGVTTAPTTAENPI